MTTNSTDERAELLGVLAEQREALLITVRGLSDDSAARRSTTSELTLGGLIKHVTAVERRWMRFVRADPVVDEMSEEANRASLRMFPGESFADLLDDYRAAAADTERTVRALPGVDVTVGLSDVPWFPPETRWSVRHVLLHLIRETAQHSGHADIIRESIDGANTSRQLIADFGFDQEPST